MTLSTPLPKQSAVNVYKKFTLEKLYDYYYNFVNLRWVLIGLEFFLSN